MSILIHEGSVIPIQIRFASQKCSNSSNFGKCHKRFCVTNKQVNNLLHTVTQSQHTGDTRKYKWMVDLQEKMVLPKSALDTLHSSRALGSRIKQIEQSVDHIVGKGPLVVRLDGVGFSRFTKGIHKPFDVRFAAAMESTAKDLLERFPACLVFHQSDEFSIVFPTQHEALGQGHLYGGRIQKIVSVLASFGSARFNHYLLQQNFSDCGPEVEERMKSAMGHFDARVLPCPDAESAMWSIYWRSAVDGPRNAVRMLAQAHFSHHQLHKQSTLDMIQLLSSLHIDSCDPKWLYGTVFKKKSVTFEAMNQRTGMPVQVVRSKVTFGSFNWSDYSKEQLTEFVLAPLWESHHPK
jgi:tRNA(His) guanylyltransferase